MKTALFAALALSLAACASKQTVDPTISGDAPLSTEDRVLVAVPEDGRYQQIVYHGSGAATARAVEAAFAQRLRSATLGERYESRAAALKAAEASGSDYLIEPKIVHWEDRATEWSGRPDRIRVSIAVIDVTSRMVVHSATIRGRSSWWTLGGDRPGDLLAQPVAEFASRAVAG